MQTSSTPPITLQELARQILALPPERQASVARYRITDYNGEPVEFSVFGIAADRSGEPFVEGNDRRTYDNPQRGPI
jgi:hypothetical protein